MDVHLHLLARLRINIAITLFSFINVAITLLPSINISITLLSCIRFHSMERDKLIILYPAVRCYQHSGQIFCCILCLWFRASLIYINNYPTRCNTKQSIYYSASSLYMVRMSTTWVQKTVITASGTGHIFCAATSLQRGHLVLHLVGELWTLWRLMTTIVVVPHR